MDTTIIYCSVCSSTSTIYISQYISKDNLFLSVDSIRMCNNCGLVFAYPMPSDDELERYYGSGCFYELVANPYSKESLEFSFRVAQSKVSIIFKIINSKGINKVLDIGAGNAQLGKAIKMLFPHILYDAVEPDGDCRDGWGSWVSNEFKQHDEAPKKQYEVVMLNHILEHLNKPIQFIDEIGDHLSKMGYLYIDVPNKDYLYKPTVDPHLLFFSKKSLEIALKQVGYSIIFCDTVGMKMNMAKSFFGHHETPTIYKLLRPFHRADQINKILNRIGLEQIIDSFKLIKSDTYGGNRQWLRCIAQKMF